MCVETVPEGVYWAPWKDAFGNAVAVAVDADGRRVAEYPVRDGADLGQLEERLRRSLPREGGRKLAS